jgi:putative protease
MVTHTVELLAPAGSPEALDAAIGEGADGVYLGLKNFNARLRSANFTYSQFEGALRSLRRMGRRLYVTVNTVFEQREADRVYQLLKYLAALGPDGIIVQDFGVAKMVRDMFPSLKLHGSTQMNIASARGANLLSKHGFSRVVLARELALEEIRAVREQTNLELEVFVHGALCVSASGLCLFSSFLGGKSANKGMCTQACRRLYHTPHEEGYFFSPGDLQLIRRIPVLVEAGVNSFKIEGRMKSAEYVGTVVAAYRRAIDGFLEEPEKSVGEGLELLRNDFARTKTEFYFSRGPGGLPVVDWLNPGQDGGTGIPLGALLKVKGSGAGRRGLIPAGAVMPGIGDSVRLHRSDDSDRRSHKLTASEPEQTAKEKSPNRWISIPEGFNPGDSVYLIQTRGTPKRYTPVIPRNLTAFRRCPGRDSAPEITLPPIKKTAFPEGIYAAVSEIEDLYIVQSVRPVRVLLSRSEKAVSRLLDYRQNPLPFTPEELILVLDPWFPQDAEGTLGEEISRLLALGYRQFVINNPGQLSYFRAADRGALIAGPWLYAFNRWSAAFIAGLGLDNLVSPLENNRQNLERTVSPNRRRGVFVTVFAYPALFRIRSDLGSRYGFEEFSDSRDEWFRLVNRPEGSMVIPEKPFSIVDKLPFLKESGFRRFIVDLSGPPLKKKNYKDLMTAVKNAAPLPGISRFNWKNGFYAPDDPRPAAQEP